MAPFEITLALDAADAAEARAIREAREPVQIGGRTMVMSILQERTGARSLATFVECRAVANRRGSA